MPESICPLCGGRIHLHFGDYTAVCDICKSEFDNSGNLLRKGSLAVKLSQGDGASRHLTKKGTCGTINWEICGSQLIISGSGPMPWAEGQIPWKDFCGEITEVRIIDEVEDICRSAFMDCTRLKRVVIVSKISIIREYAFKNCISLIFVSVPEGLVEIQDGAFEKCRQLVDFVLPSSVKKVTKKAFWGCSLFYDRWTDGKRTICSTFNRGILSIKGNGEMPWKGSYDLFYDDTPWRDYKNSFYNTYASNGARVNSVQIGSGIESISCSAFDGCYDMSRIELPDTIKMIDNCAFRKCGLFSIRIPDSVKWIGQQAFASCKNLKEITLPKGITKISREVFSDCKSLTEITIPESVSYIEEDAFKDCINLVRVICDCDDIAIDDSAFYGCSKLIAIIRKKDLRSKDYPCYCPVCRQELVQGRTVCPRCGIQISDWTTLFKTILFSFCPVCGQELEQGTTTCPKCGTQLKDWITRIKRGLLEDRIKYK